MFRLRTLQSAAAVSVLAVGLTLTAGPVSAKPCLDCEDPELPPGGGDPGCSLTLTSDPTVTPNPKVGVAAGATTGTWSGASSGITYSISWYRNSTAIGAHGSTYQPVAADLGADLRAAVVAKHSTVCPNGKVEYSDLSGPVVSGDAPSVITPPALTGNAVAGQTLTVSGGTWAYAGGGAPDGFHFAWYRNSVEMPDSVNQSTYVVKESDHGQDISVHVRALRAGYADGHQASNHGQDISVHVRALRAGYADGHQASNHVVVAVPALQSTAAPTISGTPGPGATLTAGDGSWSPAATSVTYQWLRGGTAISGATAKTYVITPSDHGKQLSVRVTGSRANWTSTSATSAPVSVPVLAISMVTAPRITGAPSVGSILTADPGTWSVAPTAVTHQWLRDGVAIAGATAATYVVAETDQGHSLTVTVGVSAPGYTGASATTAAVPVPEAPVVEEPQLTWAGPTLTILGTARPGNKVRLSLGKKKLRAGFGGADRVRLQWFRGSKRIKGATKRAYLVRRIDRGKRLRVKVVATKVGATRGIVWSSPLKVRR